MVFESFFEKILPFTILFYKKGFVQKQFSQKANVTKKTCLKTRSKNKRVYSLFLKKRCFSKLFF